MASPALREISAIRFGVIGMRPRTVASTYRLFSKLVTRTLVLKARLGWAMANPVTEGLYEAFPDWDWAKQKSGKTHKITKTAVNRFITNLPFYLSIFSIEFIYRFYL
jgi:hypothetical protein